MHAGVADIKCLREGSLNFPGAWSSSFVPQRNASSHHLPRCRGRSIEHVLADKNIPRNYY